MDTENYLILDDIYLSGVDELKIKKVFPEMIPACATAVEYEYECELNKNKWSVLAAWCLPEVEYAKEKQRISEMAKKQIEIDGVEYYNVSGDQEYCHVEFHDGINAVVYYDVIGYYYRMDEILGVVGWQ